MSRLSDEDVCRRCGSLVDNGTSGCPRCSRWSSMLIQARSVFVFEGVVRASIHRLKYRRESARSEWCATEMARSMPLAFRTADVLIPVPLHRSRLRERGYNQSERIARSLGAIAGIEMADVLERTRPTVSQVGLTAEGRWSNVTGAFRATTDIAGVSVLLIDDVMTTGATLQECASACLKAGAKEVRSYTVATGG